MFLIKAIYLMISSGHRRLGSPSCPVKPLKGSILVVYISARCRPVSPVTSFVNLVVEDGESAVWLSLC